jgi:hypothetical protein
MEQFWLKQDQSDKRFHYQPSNEIDPGLSNNTFDVAQV